MKKAKTPPATLPVTPEEATGSNWLRLRKRPVANLTEDQMEDAAGGHPHPATCEPTCPATCCSTCPITCANAYSCPDTCRGDGDTCDVTCGEECPGDSLDAC